MKDNTTYFEGTISKINSLSDFSTNLTINVPEYSDEDVIPKLFRMRKINSSVKVLITTERVTSDTVEVIEDLKVIATGKVKSPSQKLRNKFFHKFIEMGGDPSDFNKYYDQEIDDICSSLNSDIEEIKKQ
jgi:hypothetical protein